MVPFQKNGFSCQLIKGNKLNESILTEHAIEKNHSFNFRKCQDSQERKRLLKNNYFGDVTYE